MSAQLIKLKLKEVKEALSENDMKAAILACKVRSKLNFNSAIFFKHISIFPPGNP